MKSQNETKNSFYRLIQNNTFVGMNRLILFFLGLILCGCVPQKQYDELEAKYYKALQDNLKLSSDASGLSQQLEEEKLKLQRSINQLQSEIDNQKAIVADCEKNLESLQNDYDALAQDNDKQLAENAKKNKQLLADLEKSRALLTQKESQLKSNLDRVKELESLLQEQRNSLTNLKESLSNALRSFDGKGITVQEKNGQIYVSMDNKLLFASGKWVVQQEGIRALGDVAKVLNQQPDLVILVEGHTDNVPYTAQEQIKDNWDLSVMRATAITKILQSKGVKPTQMTAGGRGEYLPLYTNSNPDGRAKNRRVEIILTPNLTKINELLNSI